MMDFQTQIQQGYSFLEPALLPVTENKVSCISNHILAVFYKGDKLQLTQITGACIAQGE